MNRDQAIRRIGQAHLADGLSEAILLAVLETNGITDGWEAVSDETINKIIGDLIQAGKERDRNDDNVSTRNSTTVQATNSQRDHQQGFA